MSHRATGGIVTVFFQEEYGPPSSNGWVYIVAIVQFFYKQPDFPSHPGVASDILGKSCLAATSFFDGFQHEIKKNVLIRIV